MKTVPGDLEPLTTRRRSRHRARPRTRVADLVLRVLLTPWAAGRTDTSPAPPGRGPSPRAARRRTDVPSTTVDEPRTVQTWWTELTCSQRLEVHALAPHEPLPDALVVSLLVHGVALDTGPDPARVRQPPDLVDLLDRDREHRRRADVQRPTRPRVASVLDLQRPHRGPTAS